MLQLLCSDCEVLGLWLRAQFRPSSCLAVGLVVKLVGGTVLQLLCSDCNFGREAAWRPDAIGIVSSSRLAALCKQLLCSVIAIKILRRKKGHSSVVKLLGGQVHLLTNCVGRRSERVPFVEGSFVGTLNRLQMPGLQEQRHQSFESLCASVQRPLSGSVGDRSARGSTPKDAVAASVVLGDGAYFLVASGRGCALSDVEHQSSHFCGRR